MSALPLRRPRFLGAFRLLLALLAMGVGSQALAATTFYVRTDGGDASQCTGRGDAAYPGSGTGQNCAWKSPHLALPSAGSPRIAGGDTLIIGAGSYMIGYGSPGAAGGRCSQGGPYDCYLAAVPSGPSVTNKTRILGRGHDSGCTAPPKFWGTERVSVMLNLESSSNVEVGCLEITDQSDCIEFHSNASVKCRRDTAPYGNWASVGVSSSQSANVWLHDLNIHGLANAGIMGGGLTNWTVERTKIRNNGWVGWNGDIGSGSSNSGQIVLRRVVIAWNGCGERWQTGEVHGCWAQQTGGYGDGLGTAQTGGQWIVEDSWIHHNTSDGLDLLYMDGGASSQVIVRRVYAAANAGNQLKTRGKANIQNSVVIGNCAYFSGRFFMVAGDHCRAMGNALSVVQASGTLVNIRHNTIVGEGDCLLLTEGGNSASRTVIANNVFYGQPDYHAGGSELACGHYAYSTAPVTTYYANAFWNVKSNQCPAGSICGQNLALKNMTMALFDATPLPGSPLLGRASPMGPVTQDYNSRGRPVGSPSDIGAIEVY